MKLNLTADTINNTVYLRSMGLQPDEIVELYEISGKLHKLAEQDCNRGLTERQESTRTKLAARVESLAGKANARFHICHDPRSGRGLDFYWLESYVCGSQLETRIMFFV